MGKPSHHCFWIPSIPNFSQEFGERNRPLVSIFRNPKLYLFLLWASVARVSQILISKEHFKIWNSGIFKSYFFFPIDSGAFWSSFHRIEDSKNLMGHDVSPLSWFMLVARLQIKPYNSKLEVWHSHTIKFLVNEQELEHKQN